MDERLGLSALIEQHLSDPRTGRDSQFSLPDLLRQSIYSRLATEPSSASNQRGTAEPWIKESRTRPTGAGFSCHRFRANEVRLRLGVIAYNLGNPLRRLVV